MQLHRAPAALLVLTALALLIPAGCAKKDSVTNPGSGPTASFTAEPVVGDRPLNVVFTNHSSAGSSPITSVLWDFGDGQTSSQTNPGHLYSSAGTYSVVLTVTTAVGSNTQPRADYIVVGNGPGTTPPNALFSGTPTAGNAPLNVSFTDHSTPGSSPITAWSWDFGDLGVSSLQNPSHTYSVNGTYTVRLAVTTSVGTDTLRQNNYITVTPAPVGPTAQFSGTPTSGQAPLTVNFTDQSSPGTAAITARTWNFGDGTATSSETNPSHAYTAAGSYTVSLTVTTSVGSDSESKPAYVTVNPAPVPPTADFSGAPTAGPAPLDVQFTDHSAPGTSPITTWAWTFGDSGTASSANPSHTYASPGSYSVSLTVTTTDGQNTRTRASYIQPCQTPTTDFIAAPTTGVATVPVQFTDQTTGGPTTWSWSFGDGGSSTTKNPSHTYSTPGTYTVSLTAGNACGTNTNTKVGYITMADPCPSPIYSLVNASWDTIKPAGSTFHTSARLRWNADVSPATCARSVFAKIYYRLLGVTAWTFKGQSAICYTITDSRTTDLGSFTVSGLPLGCYDFRIDLLECGGTEVKATRGPGDDVDLTNQCFGP